MSADTSTADAWDRDVSLLSFDESDAIEWVLNTIKPGCGPKCQYFISVSDIWLKKITISLPSLFTEDELSLLEVKLREQLRWNYDFDFLYQDNVRIDDEVSENFLRHMAFRISNCLDRDVELQSMKLARQSSHGFKLRIRASCAANNTYVHDPERHVQSSIDSITTLFQSTRHPIAHRVLEILILPA